MKLPEPAPKRRRKPTAAPAEVVSAAEQAAVLARFATLVDFYGDGRKLTQTGQPTLADARALVELLGTTDRFDETIGDRTFKTKSAAELPELGFTLRWAITAGALRKERGRLRATATWRKLDGKPLERWLKAADALPALGPLAAYHANARCRAPDEFLDEVVPEILHALHDNAVLFDAVLDGICERAEIAYEWLTPLHAGRRTSAHLLRLGPRSAHPHPRVGRHRRPGRRHRRARSVGRLTRTARWWHPPPHAGRTVVARLARPILTTDDRHSRRSVALNCRSCRIVQERADPVSFESRLR